MVLFPDIVGIQISADDSLPKCTCEKTGKQKCPIHKVCIKCHHQVCPHCGDWCDTMLYKKTDQGNHCEQTGLTIIIGDDFEDDYPVACCNGICTYE
jgi:hypothetical protein